MYTIDKNDLIEFTGDLFLNKSINYSFEYILSTDLHIDLFTSEESVCRTILHQIGKLFKNKLIMVNGDVFKVMDYDIGKGGHPHKLNLAFGLNLINFE